MFRTVFNDDQSCSHLLSVCVYVCVLCSCSSAWSWALCRAPPPAPRWTPRAPARTPSSPSTSARCECVSSRGWWAAFQETRLAVEDLRRAGQRSRPWAIHSKHKKNHDAQWSFSAVGTLAERKNNNVQRQKQRWTFHFTNSNQLVPTATRWSYQNLSPGEKGTLLPYRSPSVCACVCLHAHAGTHILWRSNRFKNEGQIF